MAQTAFFKAILRFNDTTEKLVAASSVQVL